MRAFALIYGATMILTSLGPDALFAQHDSPSIDAGVELGRITARMQGADSILWAATAQGPATTFSADAALDYNRLQLAAQVGGSGARSALGGYGHLYAAYRAEERRGRPCAWLVAADATVMAASGVKGAGSGGLGVQFGRPDALQLGARFGGRWRAGAQSPVATLDVSRSVNHLFAHSDLSLTMSASATRTAFTGVRETLLYSGGNVANTILTRESVLVSLLDLRIRPRLVRGRLALEAEGGWRLGRSASVWDDPVPRTGEGFPSSLQVGPDAGSTYGGFGRLTLQRERDKRFTAAVRGLVQVTPAVSVHVEGGRRSSDPITGVSGMRYAGISLRLSLPSGRASRLMYGTSKRAVDRFLIDHGELLVDADTGSSGRGGARVLVVRGISGERVEIAGDFTDWQPVLLTMQNDESNLPPDAQPPALDTGHTSTRSSAKQTTSELKPARWSGRFRIASGAHHIVVRVDGGPWRAPLGMPVVADNFGGTAGLLVIP